MRDNDSHEQYTSPSRERYSHDRGKRSLPSDVYLPEDAQTPISPLIDAPPLVQLSASLQRAAGTPPLVTDAVPTRINHPTLFAPSMRIYRVVGIAILIVLLVTSVLVLYTNRHASTSSLPFVANTGSSATQVREATQLAVAQTSVAATNAADLSAPLYSFAAQVPGPCGDSLHWAWGGAEVKPTCLADGVQITSSTLTESSLSAPIIIFGFPGGEFLYHYRVSITFSDLQTTLAVASDIGQTCGEFHFHQDDGKPQGFSVCQDGSWSTDYGPGLNGLSGQCVRTPSRNYTVQIQVDAAHTTFFCNNTTVDVEKNSIDFHTLDIEYTLFSKFNSVHQGTILFSLKASDFSYTPLP